MHILCMIVELPKSDNLHSVPKHNKVPLGSLYFWHHLAHLIPFHPSVFICVLSGAIDNQGCKATAWSGCPQWRGGGFKEESFDEDNREYGGAWATQPYGLIRGGKDRGEADNRRGTTGRPVGAVRRRKMVGGCSICAEARGGSGHRQQT